MADEKTERYRLLGMKGPGEKVDRVILEGSSTNPVRYIDLGGEGDLTEEEVANLKDSGHRLSKVGESSSDDEGDAPAVETRADQQRAQAASTGNPADKPAGKKS